MHGQSQLQAGVRPLQAGEPEQALAAFDAPVTTTPMKLRHDLEQLEHLLAGDVPVAGPDGLIDAHRRILEGLPDTDGDAAIQIAQELRAALPDLLADHPLQQLWAYKYDSAGDGIGVRADSAAVHVNLWITPDPAKP